MTSQPKVYVFDLDGTLFCLPIDWERLFGDFKAIMHVDSVRPLVDTISKLDEKTRREVFDRWDNTELSIFENVTPCNKGLKLYHEAHLKGKPKALVTLQGKRIVELLVSRFNLNFDVILTREESLFRSEQLQMALEKLKISAKDALFVGNSENDSLAAQEVGCAFYKVS